MLDSILVPLDGSVLAQHALAAAVSLARRTGGMLHLVHVHTGASPLLADAADMPEHAYLAAMAREAEHAGVAVVTAVLQDPLATLLPSTRPTRSIADALREYSSDHAISLVVISSHGHGGLRRAWIGSVADALVRSSPVPVLVVRARRAAPPPPDAFPLRRIVLPLDGSPAAEAALPVVIALARATAGHVVAVRAVEPLRAPANPYVQWLLPPMDDVLERAHGDAERYLEEVAERLRGHGASVETEVTRDTAVNAIRAAVRVHEADVIVIASHGAGGATRALLGSVADKLIRSAAVPVLVTHPD